MEAIRAAVTGITFGLPISTANAKVMTSTFGSSSWMLPMEDPRLRHGELRYPSAAWSLPVVSVDETFNEEGAGLGWLETSIESDFYVQAHTKEKLQRQHDAGDDEDDEDYGGGDTSVPTSYCEAKQDALEHQRLVGELNTNPQSRMSWVRAECVLFECAVRVYIVRVCVCVFAANVCVVDVCPHAYTCIRSFSSLVPIGKEFTIADVISGEMFRTLAPNDTHLGNIANVMDRYYGEDSVMNALTQPASRPPIKYVFATYGINLRTPRAYRFVHWSNNTTPGGEFGLQEEIYETSGGRWYSHRRGALRDKYLRKNCMQKGGDGTVPYRSLSWAHTWLEGATHIHR
jgi:Lecithin:cholesterol acyltransferase